MHCITYHSWLVWWFNLPRLQLHPVNLSKEGMLSDWLSGLHAAKATQWVPLQELAKEERTFLIHLWYNVSEQHGRKCTCIYYLLHSFYNQGEFRTESFIPSLALCNYVHSPEYWSIS